MSELGLGLAPAGLLGLHYSEVEALVNSALDCGICLFDTAASYGTAEADLGRALRGRQSAVTLVTKCGDFGADPSHPAWSPALIRRTVDRSLKLLGKEPLDIVLLHSCPLEQLRRGEALDELCRLRDAGKIRHIGYSGDNDASQYACALEAVEVVELSLSVVDQTNAQLVLPQARRFDTGLLVKRPLGNAPWLTQAERRGRYKTYAEPYRARLLRMLPELEQACGALGSAAWIKSWLGFVLAYPEVGSMLVGTTRVNHVHENAAWVGALVADQNLRGKLEDLFVRSAMDEWLARE